LKKILLALLVLVVLAAGALALTFTSARLPAPPPLGDASLPRADPPAGMTLTTLPTGFMRAQAAFSYRGGSFGDAREFSMTAMLIHHPRGDMLIDTGFGREVDAQVKQLPWLMRVATTYSKGTPVVDRLASSGDGPPRLAGVIITHAHWDHVSGLPDLKGVPVWLNAAERKFIDSGAMAARVAHSFGPLRFEIYEFEGGPYLGFPRHHDVFGDGSIVLVPAPGHTPGSIVAFVTLPSGARYALLGDLVWQREGIELPAERPWLSRRLGDLDAGGVAQNIGRVAAIHARFPDLHLLPAHDARQFAQLPVFPQVTR